MRGFFNLNSPLMQFLSKVFDCIVLNILTILCSVPIITLGAATAGMYYAIGRQRRNEGSSVVKDFFHGFASNFRQATGMWLILLPVGVLIVFSMLCAFSLGGGFTVMGVIAAVCFVVYMMVFTWAYPLLTRFDNTVLRTIRNAFLCAITHPLSSLLTVIAQLIPFGLLMLSTGLFAQASIYILVIWYAMIGHYVMWLFRKPFAKLEEMSQRGADPTEAEEEVISDECE